MGIPFKKRRGRPAALGSTVPVGASRQVRFGNLSPETVKANEDRVTKLRSMLVQKGTEDAVDQDSSNLFGDETADFLEENVGDMVGDIVEGIVQSLGTDDNELQTSTPKLQVPVSDVNVSDPPTQLNAARHLPPPGVMIPMEDGEGRVLANIIFDAEGNIVTATSTDALQAEPQSKAPIKVHQSNADVIYAADNGKKDAETAILEGKSPEICEKAEDEDVEKRDVEKREDDESEIEEKSQEKMDEEQGRQ